MTQTTEEILAARRGTHGEYIDNAGLCWELVRVYMSSPGWARLTDAQRETLHMTAHKQARILGGDPDVADHWADIAGYNRLIVERIDDGRLRTVSRARVGDRGGYLDRFQQNYKDATGVKFNCVLPEDMETRVVRQQTDYQDVHAETAELLGTTRAAVLESFTREAAPPAEPPPGADEWRREVSGPEEEPDVNLRDGRTVLGDVTDSIERTLSIARNYISLHHGGEQFFNVDRRLFTEGQVAHLPRIPIAATTVEHASLPRYYQFMYTSKEADEYGRFHLGKAYHERWGK